MLKGVGHSKRTEYLWDLKTRFSSVFFANLSFRGDPAYELHQQVTCECLYNFLIAALPTPLCDSVTPCLFWNKTNIICKFAQIFAQSNSSNCSHCVHHPSQENEPSQLSHPQPVAQLHRQVRAQRWCIRCCVLIAADRQQQPRWKNKAQLFNMCPCSKQSLEFPAPDTPCRALGAPC